MEPSVSTPVYQNFINGHFLANQSGETFDVTNPATGEVITKIAVGNKEDVDFAVKSARKAFESWSKLTGAERGKYLFRVARIIQRPSR